MNCEGYQALVVAVVMLLVGGSMSVCSAIRKKILEVGTNVYSRLSKGGVQDIDTVLDQMSYSGAVEFDPVLKKAWLATMKPRSIRRYLAIVGGICRRHEQEQHTWK